MVNELLKTEWNGKTWYVDFRLEEIRNVQNPHDRLSFEEWDDAADEDETQRRK